MIFSLLGLMNFAVSLATFLIFGLNFTDTLSDQFGRVLLCIVIVSAFNYWMLKDYLE